MAESNSTGLAQAVAEGFQISRQAAARHVRALVDEGVLEAEGRTKDRVYRLKRLAFHEARLTLNPSLQEDIVWTEHAAPYLAGVPDNVRRICQYGFTEMMNNAIEHSEGTRVEVTVQRTAAIVRLRVADDGVGVFEKIRRRCGLDDARQAILELAKGKLTTAPQDHTGQGIFFTSRIFDEFSMLSGQLVFGHVPEGDNWLLEDRGTSWSGTAVAMAISPLSPRTLQEVFDTFAGPDDYAFTRTHVPVVLAQYGRDELVSRSQARRVLQRFERFREILLDFADVELIGQAFADEIFRVFRRAHPEIQLKWVRANDQVEKMIRRALAEDTPAPPAT